MGSRLEARLDGAVDEARPAVRNVGAGKYHTTLRAAHLRVVTRVPAGRVDRPGAACVLVGEPVVPRCVDELVARQDLVEVALEGGGVVWIAALCVDAEADLELRAVVEQRLRVEVAERVAGPDRVLEDVATAGAEEDLDPARHLAGGDPLLLAFRQSPPD